MAFGSAEKRPLLPAESRHPLKKEVPAKLPGPLFVSAFAAGYSTSQVAPERSRSSTH